MRGARIFPHVYQKKVQMRSREAMTSSVYIRFPVRLAGRFFSGLSFTGFPSTMTRTSLTGLAFKRRTADFRW
jgi:hypothetical protein